MAIFRRIKNQKTRNKTRFKNREKRTENKEQQNIREFVAILGETRIRRQEARPGLRTERREQRIKNNKIFVHSWQTFEQKTENRKQPPLPTVLRPLATFEKKNRKRKTENRKQKTEQENRT